MRTITRLSDPLDCVCWAYVEGEYCPYCNEVCLAMLEDFECGVGDWRYAGKMTAREKAEEIEHLAAVAEWFDEGRAPTPGYPVPGSPGGGANPFLVRGPATNYMADLGDELPLPGGSSKASGVKRGKARAKARGRTPYDRSCKK